MQLIRDQHFKRISKIIDKDILIKENKDLPKINLNKSDICFEKVSFQYNTTNIQIIKNISFDIAGGTMAAFAGHLALEKYTKSFTSIYDPQKGVIKIDNQDISKVRLSSLRRNISLVSQDIILFDDTIKNNIAYAKNGASQNEMKACEKVAAMNLLINFQINLIP